MGITSGHYRTTYYLKISSIHRISVICIMRTLMFIHLGYLYGQSHHLHIILKHAAILSFIQNMLLASFSFTFIMCICSLHTIFTYEYTIYMCSYISCIGTTLCMSLHICMIMSKHLHHSIPIFWACTSITYVKILFYTCVCVNHLCRMAFMHYKRSLISLT